MKNMFKVIASMACALALAACGGGHKNDVDTTVPAQPAFKASDNTVGSGTVATAGKLVTVNYTGYLYDEKAAGFKGQQFETTFSADVTKTPNSPIAFVLGSGSVIVGWDQGVVGMKVGGSRTLIIPASLAYGAQARKSATGVVIPSNSALVFDVTLVAVGQ
ncbi:FKBP-type peptidyl-prolyl cis-trans isomerase [Pseudoduganella violaceinigra]|uniref:FKBP-type peptidyl-prolyl cis-trans isomerase n=1 Tax=Pseudoduganella violaceinigra TaxID=246602 RepID=UPI00041D144D|nr:FKBP-type peptidyl-prolyl cis-trans isomerase [Pseudoduganella violaceinigra]